jgi:hypothetical protein
MIKLPIMKFEQWLMEAVDQTAVVPATSGGVAICSAFSSESNIMAAFAKELAGGFETTKKYTFKLRTFDDVINLNNSIQTAKVEPITDVTQNDILIINNKSIIEKGEITLIKADVPGMITITASNNGILTLVRLGKCITQMKEDGILNIASCKDWAVKLEIGNQVEDPLARGFKYWAAAQGFYAGTANGIATGALMLAARSAGMPESWLRTTDETGLTYYKTYVKPYEISKDYQGALNLLAKNMGDALAKKNVIIADSPMVNIVNFNTLIRTLAPKFVNAKPGTAPGRKVDFSSAYPILKQVVSDIATAIAIGNSAEAADAKAKAQVAKIGFEERVSTVMQTYSTFLKDQVSRANLPFAADLIQPQTQFLPGAPVKTGGIQTSYTKKQGEGQID